MVKAAIDTNILIYLHEENDSEKKKVAMGVMENYPAIASQVISEYLNTLKRLTKKPKLQLIEHCLIVSEGCEIISFNYAILEKAKDLIVRYDFQLFDSLVVASALEANCTELYSEDLQHNQLIENKLRIINPFV